MSVRCAYDRVGSRYLAGLLATALVGCSGGAGASASGTGVAVAKVADWEWRIPGTCEFSGDDMTFTAPGDPLLSVGFNSAGTPTAVGNLSSASEGFVSFIGHPEVPKPAVTVGGKTYSVKGAFFVDTDISVDGDVTVTCD